MFFDFLKPITNNSNILIIPNIYCCSALIGITISENIVINRKAVINVSTVDIYIPTYNESLDVVRDTVLAAQAIESAVCASSVTVSTAIPPISSRALRRITAHEPQKKVAFQLSLPRCTVFRVDNPMLGRGLTFPQRLCYLNAMLHFQYGLPRIIFLTAPMH
mgnify:CR=1 FL=1